MSGSSFMFDWVYSEKVKSHFMEPRNILDDPDYPDDGKGLVGSMACGDQMLVAIQVDDGRIKDIKWKTYGCASAIASTSMMSEMVKGMTLEEAYMLTPEMITQELGGLPQHKFHCSVLGDKALRAAIDDYLDRQGMENPYRDNVAQIICECKNVTDHQIEELIKSGKADTLKQVQEITGLGTVCGSCVAKAGDLVHELLHMYGK